MPTLSIRGMRPLAGTVRISGAKNAALPIMAAALLTEGPTVLSEVPMLTDVEVLSQILAVLGVRVERKGANGLRLEVVSECNSTSPYELVSRMRASICVLGPLLARRGKAAVPMPGGCVIGPRPVDLHLKGLAALGAEIRMEHGNVVVSARRLKGTRVDLGGPFGSTVLGTANVVMAAVLAEGATLIDHAASEPEIQDLACYLNACGARITGIGTGTLHVEGVRRLHGAQYRVIPDRIEAGTLAAAAAITGGSVTLLNVRAEHMQATIDAMRDMGVEISQEEHAIRVSASRPLKGTSFSTLPYPGVPTDVQPQLTAMAAVADGNSVVTEHVHPERFTHIAELNRLGAHITQEGNRALVCGVKHLTGAPVTAPDLRAGASLVVAGLAAKGQTVVHRAGQIERGYERIDMKLRALGADINRHDDASASAQ